MHKHKNPQEFLLRYGGINIKLRYRSLGWFSRIHQTASAKCPRRNDKPRKNLKQLVAQAESLLGVYPCALLKSNNRHNCACSSVGPVRTNRLDSSTVRVAPYPQPTVYSQPQVAVPDSTVQEKELSITPECQVQSSKSATEQSASGISSESRLLLQGKIATTNVGHSCVQNTATGGYGTTATIPVIQPSCVLPVEQLIGNGVLTNYSNGNCVPASPCFTTVLPANVLGVNSNACVPVTPRYQTSVVDSSVAITDCRCQAEGSGCCHSAITSFPSAQGPTSMIFVPYSLPNFPSQQRGNPAPKTSPCGGTTPVKETKGSRASSPRSHSKPDTSQHYHIFVGDLSPEIDTQTLRDAFAPFGEISDSRVVRDAQTLKSKGYGFVSFIKKSEAKSAIAAMNGRWLGSRSIRTNWATRKPPLIKADGNPLPLSFDEVYKQSSASNCTVYCGGIINGLTEELVQKIFSPFGNIQEIKIFKDKGYAFVRFSTKESAAHAIVAVHNTEVNGQMVKCSWGKESSDLANIPTGAQFDQPVANANFPYAYNQQMGYWYPQSFPAATAQIPGQYLQGGFSLGQFGYHQDFIGRLSMSSIWNGMPGQTQLPTAIQTIGQAAAIQQPNSVVAAYPVQRFQLSEDEWTTPSLLV